MELPLSAQTSQLITNAKSFLVALPETLSSDIVASGIALKLYLEKLGKQVTLVTSGTPARNLAFLSDIPHISNKLESGGSLAVVLNTTTKKLSELSYDTKENKVSIFLKATGGIFTPADVTFETSYSGMDAVFLLGVQNLEQLGSIFTENAELFYELPKINIDVNPNNEYFGAINFVDITAVAVAEVLADLFQQMNLAEIDSTIATALLSGIIVNTSSFQSATTTPRSFAVASSLIGFGARQQDIIQHVFKTKELSLLKLWGRALARLKTNEVREFAYTTLNDGDFEKTGSGIEDISRIIEEFLDNVSGFKVFMVLAEQANGVLVSFTLHPQVNTSELFEFWGVGQPDFHKLPKGVTYASCVLPGTLQDAEIKAVEGLEYFLPKTHDV